MKLLVHIGAQKTGTTAIQSFLNMNREPLRKSGIIYPIPPGSEPSHAFLAALISKRKVPEYLRTAFRNDVDKIEAYARRSWRKTKKILAREKAETCVISSEALFHDYSVMELANAKSLFSQISSSPTMISYVRSPADWFLSMILQRVKLPNDLPSIAARSPMAVLKSWAEFDCRLRVRKFDRQNLVGADILKDFSIHALSLSEEEISRFHPAPVSNVALSAEASLILQEYWTESECQPTPDPNSGAGGANLTEKSSETLLESRYLIRLLRRVDQRGKRAELIPSVRALLNGNSDEVRWLRERFNIVFGDVNYDGPETRDFYDLAHPDYSIRKLCVIDESYLAALKTGVIRQAIREKSSPYSLYTDRKERVWGRVADRIRRILDLA